MMLCFPREVPFMMRIYIGKKQAENKNEPNDLPKVTHRINLR